MKLLKQIAASLLMIVLATILSSPMALAAEDPESYRCQTPNETTATKKVNEESMTKEDFNVDANTLGHWPTYISETKKEFEDKLSAELEANQKCGEKNAFTKYIEKADCTSNGQSVVELHESFLPKGSYGEEDKNAVYDVYKGLCCMFVNKDTLECEDTRTVYFEDLNSCLEGKADGCVARQWLVSTSGAGLLKLYIKQIYTWGAGIAGFIAVVVILVSGIQIQVSGVSGDISQAKQRITQSLAGLALIFLSGVLLLAVNPDFFGS